MAIPNFEKVMLPLLSMLRDNQVRSFAVVVPAIADAFNLTAEERAQLIPSGRMTTIRSRTYWAAFYLDKARLLKKPKRGSLQITERGIKVLSAKPDDIDTSFLTQFPEFQTFREQGNQKIASPVDSSPSSSQSDLSPEETLETSYQTLRLALADELLDRLKSGSAEFFERTVVDLLVAMGYGGSRSSVAQAVGKSGDGGIDGMIREDKLGLDVVCVQAKRWSGTVGRPEVQGFSGSLDGRKSRKGVFITTSSFSKEARDFVKGIEKRIVLIDGEELATYMIDYDVGVTTAQTYLVKRIDGDYFEEA